MSINDVLALKRTIQYRIGHVLYKTFKTYTIKHIILYVSCTIKIKSLTSNMLFIIKTDNKKRKYKIINNYRSRTYL